MILIRSVQLYLEGYCFCFSLLGRSEYVGHRPLCFKVYSIHSPASTMQISGAFSERLTAIQEIIIVSRGTANLSATGVPWRRSLLHSPISRRPGWKVRRIIISPSQAFSNKITEGLILPYFPLWTKLSFGRTHFGLSRADAHQSGQPLSSRLSLHASKQVSRLKLYVVGRCAIDEVLFSGFTEFFKQVRYEVPLEA
ncbi:hypothetical protein DFH94DRAFT_337987 [Russula ochroleuca]|jgi:hypothetical protein|uniref:Uncharacterized protein n=1 Tax=Russula ochroleuca TaxID=152965 RepID=A0A9P5TCF2_9AGAM|nr:hypothetical protein DFH94DRAFT_337987 [Russula ochroleuca]